MPEIPCTILKFPLRAVIFDWDGTLIDNLPLHFRAFREALKGKAEVRKEDIYLREGSTAYEIITELAGSLPREEIKSITERKQAIYRSLSKGMKILPEGKELILYLRRIGIKTGLVTGTVRRNIEPVLGKDISLFDYIVTAETTGKHKPNPRPFMKCLDGLGVQAQEAIALENTPRGIESAKRAGMTVIAITSTLPEGKLKEADYVVSSLKEAGKIICSD